MESGSILSGAVIVAAPTLERGRARRRRLRSLLYYFRSLPRLALGLRPTASLLRLVLSKRREPQRILLRDGTRLWLRSPFELWLAAETCILHEYERPAWRAGPGEVVVDVGASIVDFAVRQALRAPEGRVIALEPDAGSFALLERNVRENACRNVVAVHAAAAARSGVVALTGEAEAARRRTVAGDASRPGEQRVRCVTLDEVLAAEVATCALLKIDVEGAEAEILGGASDGTWARIARVVVETHADDLRRRVETLLTDRGFRTKWRASSVHTDLGLLFGTRDGGARPSGGCESVRP